MILIAFFYYENEKRLYTDLVKSNLQNIASKVSTEVIFAHMRGYAFNKEPYIDNQNYEIAFYDARKQKLFGNLEQKINFKQKTQFKDQSFILIDQSTVGHLGVEYIVIKDNSLGGQLSELKTNIIVYFFLIYIIIAIIGFYLAKLFLKPIKDERERLNNFIKDTTHELNTPISAIMMSTENEQLSPKQVERVRLSANRVSEIYKDMVYLVLQNKDENKKIESLALDEVIQEQLQYFEPLALKKRITICTKLEAFKYDMNQDDLIRLLNNLISNAIKYNSVGGTIEIILKDRALTIMDNGIGIEAKKINDIFKRYVRATKEQGGFGIGLSIVKHICDDYGISISVQSKPKEGSSFKLQF